MHPSLLPGVILLLLSGVFAPFHSSAVAAGDPFVEVDLEVLDTYKPPPMFSSPSYTHRPDSHRPDSHRPDARAPELKRERKLPPKISTPPPRPGRKPADSDILALLSNDEIGITDPDPVPVPATKPQRGILAYGRGGGSPEGYSPPGQSEMPAAQAPNVQAESLFESPAPALPGQTLLERHNKSRLAPSAATDPAVAAIAPSTAPAAAGKAPDLKIGKKDDKGTLALGSLTLIFQAGQPELDKQQKDFLLRNLILPLQTRPDHRIQIQSFAKATDQGLSSDRRISLSRALAIRTFLLEKGLEPSRINVRALGANTPKNPVDRADIYILPQGAAL